MNDLKLGQFVYDNSLIHRLDPRTKLVSCSLLAGSVLINSRWSLVLVYGLLIILAMGLANMQVGKVYKSLRKLRYLLTLTFIFQAVLTVGKPWIIIGNLQVTREGVLLGTATIIRLLVIYLSASLLTVSTSPVKLASGLEAILSPLSYVKIPVQQLSIILGTSLRFVPTFIEEAEIIKKAQMSRGAQFASKKIIVRFKALLAVLIPLLAASLQRASDLAMAMECRCYAGDTNPRRTQNLRLQKHDILVLILVGSIFAYAIIDKL